MILGPTSTAKLYRYSKLEWLERSLKYGEFRLQPASAYKSLEGDTARFDNELERTHVTPKNMVSITHAATGKTIIPTSDLTYTTSINTDYYILCFSTVLNKHLYNEFIGSEACLVIHDVEEFRERLFAQVKHQLPGWLCVDAAVNYGMRHDLGAVFSKPVHQFFQSEWRFAWKPKVSRFDLDPVTVQIGTIESIASITTNEAYVTDTL